MIRIGIDPGLRNTGIAVIEDGKYTELYTMEMYAAIKYVLERKIWNEDVHVTIENPNLRKWLGEKGDESKQGAGYVKAEYAIWVQMFLYEGIPYTDVSPQSVGSDFDNVKVFKAATGWTKQTSKHARDAAKMIFQYKTK